MITVVGPIRPQTGTFRPQTAITDGGDGGDGADAGAHAAAACRSAVRTMATTYPGRWVTSAQVNLSTV